MKKLVTVLLSLAMLLVLFPQAAYAEENISSTSEQDMTSYLNETSSIRGFKVNKEDIDRSLAMYDKTKDDFNSTEEITEFLGEVIKADLSNLHNIYSKYELDSNSLVQLLKEYGEELNDYIYLNDLDTALDFYTDSNNSGHEADFDNKLAAYLNKVSTVRGLQVTKEDINSYLSEYSTSIEDFETVSDLSDYLGDVIKANLSNLKYFNDNYGLDKEAIIQLINDSGKSIDDFIFIDQLEELVWSSSIGPELDLSMYMDLLNQIGITETELQNLDEHFLSISDDISSAESQAHIEDLANRFMIFAQNLMGKGMADENYKPSDAEIAEFASLYEEFLSSVKLKISFSIIKGGAETQYSMEEIMKMEWDKDADYKIALYNDKSELLADAVITNEFIKNNFGEIGKIIEDVSNVTGVDTNNNPVKTIKGGELPKTAGNYMSKALLGIFITIIGTVIFLKIRTGKVEILEK